MRETNKPFNATTLESNLKSRTTFKKGSIEIALNQAQEEGHIVKKAYGNSLVFWYNQDLLPIVSKEEIEGLTNKILAKQQEYAEKSLALRTVNASLTKVMSSKTDEQLRTDILKLLDT